MNPWKRRVEIGDAVLFLCDAREWLASVPPCLRLDALVTDPPYGVEFAGSATRWSAPTGNTYASFDDTPENVSTICVPIVELALTHVERAAITPGIRNARRYPQPEGEGVIWYPSGANRGPWGFVTHQPIYYYGKCPYLSCGQGSRPTGFQSTEAAEQNGHPCPKPIGQMRWLVERVSFRSETILDPFMGSGTTGVACAQLGRKFIGIEIETRYFDIACRRIEDAYRQGKLFEEPRPKAKQETLI